MPGWSLIETHSTKGRTFRRALSGGELTFYWEARFMNGTSDSTHHVELRLLNPSDIHLFSETNIVKAWLSAKRRFPLAGATVQIEGGGGDTPPAPYFMVREHDLAILRPQEIVFGHVACAKEVQQQMASIWENPRPLSDKLLAQLYVFRETDPKRTNVLHLMTLMAHYVTDATANRTFMRCILDTLARGGDQGPEPAQLPLEQRLAMVIPLSDLEPASFRSLSLARQRWRRAIGSVIQGSRMAKAKVEGGHTLPRRVTLGTPHIPARPGFFSALLTEAQTTAVISNCRLHEITFGNAYIALAQVAMTRVLYQQYLCGNITEEEWAYRKRQPYKTLGAINLRPYLDKPWFENGGGGELMAYFSSFICKLPFMTLGKTERHQHDEQDLSDRVPPLSDLLTFDRFLYRTGLVKKQIKGILNHPLLLECTRMSSLIFGNRMHSRDLHGTKAEATKHENSKNDNFLAVPDMGFVIAHGGNSLGNLNLIFPTEYPLPASHPLSPFASVPHPFKAGYASPPPGAEFNTTPKIMVEYSMSHLHTFPSELYLGALTSGGRMNIYVFYDRNVYEEEIVKEWLDEVRGAVLWYLDQPHSSRCEQSGPNGRATSLA